jgi:hypothetical protein
MKVSVQDMRLSKFNSIQPVNASDSILITKIPTLISIKNQLIITKGHSVLVMDIRVEYTELIEENS